jgi:hypothetical protein
MYLEGQDRALAQKIVDRIGIYVWGMKITACGQRLTYINLD